jgi:hypothetical protein
MKKEFWGIQRLDKGTLVRTDFPTRQAARAYAQFVNSVYATRGKGLRICRPIRVTVEKA